MRVGCASHGLLYETAARELTRPTVGLLTRPGYPTAQAGGFPQQEHEDQAYWYLLRGVFKGTLADHTTPASVKYIVQVW